MRILARSRAPHQIKSSRAELSNSKSLTGFLEGDSTIPFFGVQEPLPHHAALQQISGFAFRLNLAPQADWNDDAGGLAALIGSMDTLIAGSALARRATLVTHNVREFRRVKGLRIEDWY